MRSTNNHKDVLLLQSVHTDVGTGAAQLSVEFIMVFSNGF